MRLPGHRPRVLSTKQEGLGVPPGTVFEVHSAGGGGWGPPDQRRPEAIAKDRANGFVRGARKTTAPV